MPMQVGGEDVLRDIIRVKVILYGLRAHVWVWVWVWVLVLVRVYKGKEPGDAQERTEVPTLTPISTLVSTHTPRATDVRSCVEDDRSATSEDIVKQG